MAKKENYNYFEFFKQMIECACQAADELHALAENFDRDQLSKRSKIMHDLEHKADFIKHGMLERLLGEFLPPIDREDIIQMSSRLDDIVDCIDDVAHGLYMYNISVCRPDVKDMTAIIVDCCKELTVVFNEFEKYKKTADKLRKSIIEVNRLEGEGDRLYTQATRRLFTDGTEAVAVCAWDELYRALEACCDSCERTADMVDTIILKNY